MKLTLPLAAALALLLTLNLTAFAQGTAFTYQGRLQSNGSLAAGTYNLAFTLFTTNAGGVALAGPVTNNGVAITNGLFTVQVDFGTGVFAGGTNWLEIAVETNSVSSSFVTLAPRQQLTPVPYAITAASVSGPVSAAELNGGVNGNFFVGLSGNTTTTGSNNTANGFQALTNNTTGSFNTANGYHALLANTSGSDNVADGRGALFSNTVSSFNTAVGVEALNDNISGSNNIAVGYRAGFNITTASSNIDIGSPGLSTDTNITRIGSGQSQTFIAGTIFGDGGGLTNLTAANATALVNGTSIGSGSSNSISTSGATDAFIGGGTLNQILNNSLYASIDGGQNNVIEASAGWSVIAGGEFNATYSGWSVVGGGRNNTVLALTAASTIAGGADNTNSGSFATIPGGAFNVASGEYSFAAGQQAQATNQGAFVWADSQATPFTSTNNDSFNVRAQGGVNFVTGGAGMTVDGVIGANGITAPAALTLKSTTANITLRSGTSITLQATANLNLSTSSFMSLAAAEIDLEDPLVTSSTMTLENGLSVTGGNVGIGTITAPGHLLVVGSSSSPAYCDGTTWQNGSDRNVKADFTAINPRDVLAKVSALPITQWRYQVETAGTEHLGPMAQDFHAAFGLNGSDDRHIATVDEEGVALAAIQGLNQQFQAEAKARDTEIQTLLQQNHLLGEQLDQLKAMVKRLAAQK